MKTYLPFSFPFKALAESVYYRFVDLSAVLQPRKRAFYCLDERFLNEIGYPSCTNLDERLLASVVFIVN